MYLKFRIFLRNVRVLRFFIFFGKCYSLEIL
jgi:hypothetical protein